MSNTAVPQQDPESDGHQQPSEGFVSGLSSTISTWWKDVALPGIYEMAGPNLAPSQTEIGKEKATSLIDTVTGHVSIPLGITSIGNEAFLDNFDIKSIKVNITLIKNTIPLRISYKNRPRLS